MQNRRTLVLGASALGVTTALAACGQSKPNSEAVADGVNTMSLGASQFLLGLAGANLHWLPAAKLTALANIIAGIGTLAAGGKQLADAFFGAAQTPQIQAPEQSVVAVAPRSEIIRATCRPNSSGAPVQGPLRAVWTPVDGGASVYGTIYPGIWAPGQPLPLIEADLARIRNNRLYESRVDVIASTHRGDGLHGIDRTFMGPYLAVSQHSLLNQINATLKADRNEALMRALGPGQAVYRDGVASV
jgi:hypothetical protein